MVAKKETKALVEKAAEPDLQDRIFTIRGEKVILDSDLAEIYGVEVRTLGAHDRGYMGSLAAN